MSAVYQPAMRRMRGRGLLSCICVGDHSTDERPCVPSAAPWRLVWAARAHRPASCPAGYPRRAVGDPGEGTDGVHRGKQGCVLGLTWRWAGRSRWLLSGVPPAP